MNKTLAYSLIILFALLFAGGIGSTYYFIQEKTRLEEEKMSLIATLNTERAANASTTATLGARIAALETDLGTVTDERDQLDEDLRREKQKVGFIEEQIEEITGTVGILDKLSKTDPELLQKYSKVFFLNEHYRPAQMTQIDNDYLYDESKPKFVHAQVEPHLIDLLEDAKDDGIDIWIVSAFRSFDEQIELKGQYTVTYGSGANTFSADQGYSEHQLGTTLDLTTRGLNGGLEGFETTPAYEWLLKNAYKYGFILSYPHDNAYYIFEPWHWRFVGTDLARDLHSDNKYFYDLDQRDIDEYLISIFD